MKKTIVKAVSFLKKYEIINVSPSSRALAFLGLCIIVGMICGTLLVPSLNMESLYKLDFLFLSDFKERIGQSFMQIFISSICAQSLFALIIELSAFSCWGIAVIPLSLITKGIGLGITAGYLYLIYGLKGIAFYILMLVPGIFISSIGLVFYSFGSIKFSLKLLKSVISKANSENIRPEMISHLKKSGYCLVLLGISALADVGFTAMFSKFFHF